MKPDEKNVPATLAEGDEGRFAAAMQSSRMMVTLAVLAFAVCYLRSFVLPHTPLLFWGDQLGFATKGSRIALGELPYRDFFEFVTPGTELIYGALFRLFGVSMWMPNLLMAAMAAAATLWTTWCARRLMTGLSVALPALLMTGFVLYGSMDATHHWFSTLAAMGAVAALFNGASLKRIAIAGAMCGLTVSFTQTKGAAVLIAFLGYLIWKSAKEKIGASQCWRRCLILCAAALAVFAAINGPLILATGPEHWIEDVIIFPARYFGSMPANNWSGTWPDFADKPGVLKWIVFPFIYAAVPLTYVWFFVEKTRSIKKDHNEPWDKLLLLTVVGIAMLAAIVPAPSIRRISSASPPAMIVLIWLLSRRGKIFSLFAKALGAVSVAVAAGQIFSIQTRPKQILDLPVGRVAILDSGNYEVYRWMSEHTHPGQWYFGMPPFTLPLGLLNPTPVESTGPGAYTRPEMVAAVVHGLETKPTPLIVLRSEASFRRKIHHTVDYSQPFRDYLHQHYRHIKTFSTGDEVWELINP